MNEAKLLEQARKDGIQTISTGVIALCAGQILIVRRNKDDFLGGMWEIPGGSLDENEPIIAGALRELKEETNLDALKVINYVGSFDYISGKNKKTRQFNYLVEIKPPALIKLCEHDAFEWCHPQQITRELSEKTKGILSIATKFITEE